MRRIFSLCLALMAALAAAGCDDAPTEPTPPEGPRPWRAVAGLDPALGVAMSVWGPRADDIYIVGGQPAAGVAWRFDGAAWQRLSVPEGPLLNWVHGAEGVVWMVGDGGRALRSLDGGPFEAVPTPTDAPLWGVWAADAATVWAVGGDARAASEDWAPVLLRLAGDAFEAVPLPALDRGTPALFKVWGTGPTDVIAVGARGVLLEGDGQAWRQVSLPGVADDLISLWGTGPERIIAVGGRSNGLAVQRGPEGWSRLLPDVLGARPGLNGVWVAPDGVASLVGVRGAAFQLTAAGDLIRDPTDTDLVLHAVFGVGGRRLAVGGSLDRSPPWTGITLEDTP